jgi:hypothetical protein
MVDSGVISMPNTPKKALRAEIYRHLILEHLKPVTVSRVLKIKLSTLMHHISVLVAENAILKGGCGPGSIYRRGPEYHKYELFNVQTSTLNTDGLQNNTPTLPLTRIDTAWFHCEIIKPWPDGHIWWEKEDKGLNGVIRRYKRIFWGKWSAMITAFNQKSIQIQLEPFVIDEKEIPYRDEVCMSYAIQVVRIASKALKIGLGLPELSTEPYIIEPIPELQGVHVGNIPISPTSHIDSSKRPGRPEWETRSIEEAMVYRQLPARMLLLEKSQLQIIEKLDLILKSQEATAKAMESMNITLARIASIFEKKDEDKPVKPLSPEDQEAYR